MKIDRFSKPMLLTCLCSFLLISCSKEYKETTPVNKLLENAGLVKIYNASVSSARNHFFVDGVQTSGSVIAFGASSPSGAANMGYSVLTGQRTIMIKDSSSTSAQPPQNFQINIESGKRYAVFLYDTVAAMKSKVVESVIEAPADTTSRLRLANFIHAPLGGTPAIDIYSYNRKERIFTNIQFSEVSGYIPYPSLTSDTLLVFPTGTSDTLARSTGYSTTPKRSYTIVFRGVLSTTGTGATARTLSSVTDN